MTDGLRWVCEEYPLGYTVIFCEGLTPEEVLARLGARPDCLSARKYLPTLSRGTRVIAACRDVNATQWVECAVDGRVLSSFDPGLPHYNDGAERSALAWPSTTPMTFRQVPDEPDAWHQVIGRSLP